MANVSSSNGLEKRPKLRFPGFDEPWISQQFSCVFSFLQNNTLSRAELDSDGEVLNIHYGDVLIKFGSILDCNDKDIPHIASGHESQNYQYLQNGDIIIADTAEDETVGKATELVNVSGRKVEAGLHTIPCRPLSCFASMYLGYYMNTPHFHRQLIPLMQGIKVLSISKGNIAKTKICAPKSMLEQQKISYLLNILDRRTAAQRKVIEVLKKYKRGVVQKFFSEKEMAQWETVKLKDVVDIFDGTHQTPKYKSEGVRFISVENILNPLSTEKYISNDDYRKEFKVHPEYGDVLMTRIGDIGRTCYFNFNIDMAYYVSLALFKCSSKIDGRYLAAYISTNDFQKELWERTLHIAFPKKINTGEIGECVIRLPNIARQIAISDQLDLIERVIRLTEKQYELLRAIRDGLMQQLFI